MKVYLLESHSAMVKTVGTASVAVVANTPVEAKRSLQPGTSVNTPSDSAKSQQSRVNRGKNAVPNIETNKNKGKKKNDKNDKNLPVCVEQLVDIFG